MKEIFSCVFAFLMTPIFWGQEISVPEIALQEISKVKCDAHHYVGTDSYGAICFIKDNTFYKVQGDQQWQYNNFALGEISSVSIVNPLKIAIFYEQSNSVVLVDRFLNEIKAISFNTFNPLRLVTQMSMAHDSHLWLFDSHSLQLEIFDYNALRTLQSTQPLSELPIAMAGDFNQCWVLTPTKAYHFNRYGSLLATLDNQGYTGLQLTRSSVLFKKNQEVYKYTHGSQKMESIHLPEIPIKQFYGIDEILYIYDGEIIHNYQLESP